MAFVTKGDVFVVSIQVVVLGVLVLVSTSAVDLFFRPVDSLIDIPVIGLSYIISVVAIAAFFTIFVRQDDLFRQKQRLHEELTDTLEKNDEDVEVEFAAKSVGSIFEGKNEFLPTARGVGSAAAVLLFLLKAILFFGAWAGFPMDGVRMDVTSAFTNVMYLVALFAILFKDRRIA